MLTKRIIPCLDVDGGRVVKGVSFKNIRDAGDPRELAAFYDREGADELVFLDITASSDGRETMIDVVKRVSEEVFIPLTVGGGIRSVEDVRRMLEAGADKVSLNTAAVLDPHLISRASDYFGTQCIVVAIDIKRTVAEEPSGATAADTSLEIDDETRWEVYTHGGRNATGIDALKWARRVADLGAGELLVTSMDADGQKDGYDLELMHEIGQAVTVPIIASGGAGTLEHLYEAAEGGADAILAASIFHYGEYTVREAKEYLQERGLPIRPLLDDQDKSREQQMIQLDDKGLVPAIAQNADTGEVIVLGYMSPGALKRTLEGRDVWFYSRSRSDLWHKGEVSGNYMRVKSASIDCDGDTVLLQVNPDGPICHTGNQTCFFTPLDELPEFESPEKGPGILDELFSVIQDRKRELPEGSYTTELFRDGVDRIGQKVIEESGEAVIAGVKLDKDALARESADLLYHLLVLISANGGTPEDVYAHLRERRG